MTVGDTVVTTASVRGLEPGTRGRISFVDAYFGRVLVELESPDRGRLLINTDAEFLRLVA